MALLVVATVACEQDDKTIDGLFETIERGAVLRTVSVTGGALDVLDTSAATTIEVEEQDIENGGLLSEVRVFVNLTDNTPASTTTTSETLLTTIPASDFETGPFGLPRGSFTATLGEMATALGISEGDYNCGDALVLRLELELIDGRSFSSDDVTGTVQGGSFFSSPFQYVVNLIAPLPSDDLFTGDYQLTQTAPGIFGVSDYQDGVYSVTTVNNTTKLINGVTTFPAFGGFGPVNVQFQFVCGEIVMSPGQNVGAGCNATINSGPAQLNITYDLANPDDSDFFINFTSDESDDCGTGTAQAQIRLTKV